MLLQALQLCHKPSGMVDFLVVPFLMNEGNNFSNQILNGHEVEHYPDANVAAEVRKGKSQYMPTVQGVYNKE